MPPTSVPAPAPKKGMSGLAWLGIGCGGLFLLGIIAVVSMFLLMAPKFKSIGNNPEKAAAEMMVSLSPELTKISQDDEKGTMKIRMRDGKELTLSYKDIAEGKITMTNENGETTTLGSTDLSQIPAWVPKADDFSDGVSMFHSEAGGMVSGQFSGKSSKGVEDLKEYFQSAASAQGLSSNSSSSMSLNGTAVATLEYSGSGKTLKIVITEKPGSPTLINTHYSEN